MKRHQHWNLYQGAKIISLKKLFQPRTAGHSGEFKTNSAMQRRGGKMVKASGDGGHQNKRPSRHNRKDVHMNSQRLWRCAQHLHRFTSDGIPGLRGEVGTSLHP